MENIRYIKLKNKGGFVAKITVQYKGKHTDEHGNVSYDAEWKSWHSDGYRDICAAAERTVDLTDSDIPDGSQVRLKAVIVAGRDHTASEQSIYNKESSKMAFYKVSGTTYINDKLELISCK